MGEEQSNLNEPKGETALEELKEDIDIQILVVLALNTTTEKCSKAFEFLKSLRGMGFEEKVKEFLKKLLSESLSGSDDKDNEDEDQRRMKRIVFDELKKIFD